MFFLLFFIEHKATGQLNQVFTNGGLHLGSWRKIKNKGKLACMGPQNPKRKGGVASTWTMSFRRMGPWATNATQGL